MVVNQQAQVHTDYDLFVLAGSSLGLLQGVSSQDVTAAGITLPSHTATWPVTVTTQTGAQWTQSFYDHVRLALLLHNITEVWVFDHLDCGAYKNFQLGLTSHDTDIAPHVHNLTQIKKLLLNKYPDLYYKGFVIDTNYTIFKKVDTGGIIIPDPSNNNNSQKIYFIGFFVLLFLGIILLALKQASNKSYGAV
jgi:hypothetical protein